MTVNGKSHGLEGRESGRLNNDSVIDEVVGCTSTGLGLFWMVYRFVRLSRGMDVALSTLVSAVLVRSDIFYDPSAPLFRRSCVSRIAAPLEAALHDELDPANNHQDLAHATLQAIVDYFGLKIQELEVITGCVDVQVDQYVLAMQDGYGQGRKLDDRGLFRAFGFHDESENRALMDFVRFVRLLTTQFPELVAFLKRTSVQIGPREHNAWMYFEEHVRLEARHLEDSASTLVDAFGSYQGTVDKSVLGDEANAGGADFIRIQRSFFAQRTLGEVENVAA